jgi:hypothetical protein
MLEEAIRRYQNRSIETAQLILELIAMAKEFRWREHRGGRVVPHPEVRPFENAVPVYDLKIAAGRFSGEQEPGVGLQGDETAHPELFEWAELPDYYRPRPGMFVAPAK